MDMNDILKLMMSRGAAEQVSQQAGIPVDDALAVMGDVLPMLLKGMQGQATNQSTQQGFLQALSDHSKQDTSDLSKFFKNVDTDDGAKIVNHLLGQEKEAVAAKAKKKSGIDTKTVLKIMAILAPLLMTKMGSAAKESEKTVKGNIGAADVMELVGGLSDGVDMKDVMKLAKMFMK
ncbi:MAG: DUF937 domain-containing protein [Mogibacterium sp.]|nr:DUF937 domain-containing protein [Mogibacterium sp.]